MSDCLLVLGASRYQLDVIRKAKALGYRVVTTDNVPSNPGHGIADESHHIDTTDIPAVLELARTIRPKGVIAPCTDVAVATAAEVAADLGLRGIPPASARSLTSKIEFRRFMVERGFRAPSFVVFDEASAPTMKLDGAMVIKPEGSSGSKGIFIVRTPEELAQRIPETLSFSKSRRGLVEQLIEGRQATCEGLLMDGRITLHLLTERLTAPPPFVVTQGHVVPSRFDASVQARVVSTIEKVFEAYDVKSTPFDCDLVVDANGDPWLLELTPRLGGNSLVRLMVEATGADFAGAAIRLACGEEPVLPHAFEARPVAQLILGTRRAGRFHYDQAAAEALTTEPWVRRLELDYAPGDHVEAFINGRTRAGEATLTASTREELDARVIELERRLPLDALP